MFWKVDETCCLEKWWCSIFGKQKGPIVLENGGDLLFRKVVVIYFLESGGGLLFWETEETYCLESREDHCFEKWRGLYCFGKLWCLFVYVEENPF